MLQKSVAFAALALFLNLLPSAPATADGPIPGEDIVFTDISLRPGVEVDLHLRVFGRVDKACQVAVHGFIHTAASWQRYAEAIGGCVLALDLPGRGGSSLPRGLLYGDLLLEDHVTGILAVLERLRLELDIEPTTLVGHSQGGLLLQMAQQRLVEQGSNLEQAHDIREVVILASAPPTGLPAELFDSGAGLGLFLSFLVEDPLAGLIIALPAELFPALIFTNSSGQLAVGTPTVEEIVAQGWNAPGEPLLATLQLAEGQGFTRPTVDAGVFEDEPRLRVVAFEEDLIIRASENVVLYRYLTGDEAGECLAVIGGPNSVHDMYVADPATIAVALEDLSGCSY
jgi:pimeloyl-ACP methyl ester carboxylesterase